MASGILSNMPEVFRKKTAPITRIMQAVNAIENGKYQPSLLADLIEQKDDFVQLARIVDSMGRSVAFRDKQLKLLQRVIPIGVALSTEKDFNRLLETLVVEAQGVTNADAGTLYLLEDQVLRFMILRNASLGITMGGTSRNEITFEPVRLYKEDGTENRANVASYAALTRRKIMVADAYETSAGFDFSGTKLFDQRTGYRSKSFLTIPLESQEKEIIGVLQLINAKDPDTGNIISFSSDNVLDALVLLASAALAGYIREEKLRAEIAKLRIEIDDACRAKQVAEITDTLYFKNLIDKARELRSRRLEE